MEDEPVNIIRESSRNLLKLSRHFHRNEESDGRRCIEQISITSENIADIANRLKTKTSVSIIDLQTLKNGLMEDPKYIEVVLNTNGALRGLVRELSGSDVNKQCVAAACCTNLALGDARAGLAVSKAAGTYLVAALHSLTVELTVTCAWALGNMAGSGARAANVLTAQGATTKLCTLLDSTSQEIQDSALYALAHFTYQMKDELGTEHLASILTSLSNLDITISSAQLLFILSCHKNFNIQRLPQVYLQKILEDLPNTIRTHIAECTQNKICCKLVYLIRTLANVSVNENVYVLFLNYFVNFTNDFSLILSKNGVVKESLVWLLGNLFNYRSDHVFFERLLK